jgi:Kef-type K+ transport system membrane component KefB
MEVNMTEQNRIRLLLLSGIFFCIVGTLIAIGNLVTSPTSALVVIALAALSSVAMTLLAKYHLDAAAIILAMFFYGTGLATLNQYISQPLAQAVGASGAFLWLGACFIGIAASKKTDET